MERPSASGLEAAGDEPEGGDDDAVRANVDLQQRFRACDFKRGVAMKMKLW